MNTQVDSNALHAVYSPSSAHRWAQEGGCSASAEGIANSGAELHLTDGEDEEGTAAHAELERILKPLAEYGLAEFDIDPDHPAKYGVGLMFDYVRQLVRPMSTGDRIWIEESVRLTNEIWGRPDVIHWNASTFVLTVADLKNGYVGVNAEKNSQTRIYAAAKIRMLNLPAKWIRHAIVQPNDFRPVPRVKQWYEPIDSLNAFADRVVRIPHEPKKFVAGEQCTYCPLFGRCPASRDILRDVSALVAGLITPEQVSPAQRALFMACEKPIKDAFKNATNVWAKSALAGQANPGLKMIESQKHRAWSNPAAARALVLEKLGPGALDLPSPAQAIERGLDEATVHAMAPRPPGAPVLALANDTRPDWKVKTVSDMFGAAVRGKA